MSDWLDEQLQRTDRLGLRRQLRALQPVSPVEARIGGHHVVLFSTNDYLGLSGHPRVVERAAAMTEQLGLGPRGAALVCGYTELHRELEEALAGFKGTEAALLFPTGYMTNLGILQALGGRDAAIFSDALNHASIVDGGRLSRSAVHVYRHCDLNQLEDLVRASEAPRKIIVTDALFSMDGDPAPLDGIVEIKEKHGCLLVVDEAHSTLVCGKAGKGLAEHFGVADSVDVQMGTLSKAFGSLGGYVAVSQKLKDYFLNRARSFIFTTALPVPAVAAALAALDTFRSEPEIRMRLWGYIESFQQGVFHGHFQKEPEAARRAVPSPIFPVVVGQAEASVRLSERLFRRGYHVPAIRPPTVPYGTSRLRISLSAAHDQGHLDGLATALAEEFAGEELL